MYCTYRWLGFSCSGRRFACDLCHEDQTDLHEMKLAQRIVCGYCSTEQPSPYALTLHIDLSRRWLRFPCCGRRFACDLCHEEQTDGHEMKWAQRMVCGYCSTEQPLGEQCKHCSKRIASSAKGAIGATTRHWQVMHLCLFTVTIFCH